jgi:predicted negative regulator of RcsB-dependent stress response
MAVYDLEEQERLDALKDWWDKNGKFVYLAIAAFVGAVAATQGWRYYKATQTEQAETLFKNIQKISDDKDGKKQSEAAALLVEKFPGTFYATEASLLAAKASFDAKDYAAARRHLQWVAEKGNAQFRPLARLRLAAVMLEEKQYDAALKAIEEVREESYVSLAADLKGDVLMAQNKKEEARVAYQLALDKSEARSPLRQFTQFKLDALGEAK